MKSIRAEMTAKQIVSIIILIVSFSVIVLFFTMLNLKEVVDDEICRNSVVNFAISQGLGNFNCQTEDIVIDKEIVSGNYDPVYHELAELQRECFWMFGEGEIDLGDRTCAICNVVEFDLSYGSFSKEDYYKFLEEVNLEDSEVSYFSYFYKELYFETYKDKLGLENVSDFDSTQKYMVYYVYDKEKIIEKAIHLGMGGDSYSIGIAPFNSEKITALDCKKFATTS